VILRRLSILASARDIHDNIAKGGRMVSKRTKADFERAGVEAVREQVKQGDYWEGEKQQAIAWLAEQSERKKSRDSKNLLTLARRTARDTRRTLVLVGFILLVLIAELVARFFAEQGVR
jgi:hypothetical protein